MAFDIVSAIYKMNDKDAGIFPDSRQTFTELFIKPY